MAPTIEMQAGVSRRHFIHSMASAFGIASLAPRRVHGSVSAEAALASFTQTIGQFQTDPDLAASSRDEQELEQSLTSGLEGARIRTPKSKTPISARASDLIVASEVTNQGVYSSRYEYPVWPMGASGVTIGIGYDLGYVDEADFAEDWGTYLDPKLIATLRRACGFTKSSAASVLNKLAPVRITWGVAIRQYSTETLPRYVGETEAVLTNTSELKPDSLGALVSLVYNRGPSFHAAGVRFVEMRAVASHMSSKEFAKIPDDLRSMERLWADKPECRGLVLRREAEAALFEIGLNT
jgi:hypothetical protein